MSKQLILIDTSLDTDGFKSVCPIEGDNLTRLQSVENYMAALSGGNQNGDVDLFVGPEASVATITVTSTGPTNNQTMTLLNETLTAKTSGAVVANGEFNISATPAIVAANIAATINVVLADQVIASSLAGVVSISPLIPGSLGNGLQIAVGTLSNTAVGQFANGSDGTIYALSETK